VRVFMSFVGDALAQRLQAGEPAPGRA